jgi:hypothetical protein
LSAGLWAQAQRQKARSEVQTATTARAELVKGKLSPAQSKPGDSISVRLTEDVKSNGEVVLKKGTVVTGVVRGVKQVDSKNSASGHAHSMLEVEWLAPALQGNAASRVMIALQGVTQISPLYQDDASATSSTGRSSGSSAIASRPAGATGTGLLGGVSGVATSAVSAATTSVSALPVGDVPPAAATTSVNGQTNTALMSMPSIVALDSKTTSVFQSDFGFAGDPQIYKTGRGEMITGTGAHQSVDLFSRMTNDTVITSQNRNFEIGTGAQIRLLVGIEKK